MGTPGITKAIQFFFSKSKTFYNRFFSTKFYGQRRALQLVFNKYFEQTEKNGSLMGSLDEKLDFIVTLNLLD